MSNTCKDCVAWLLGGCDGESDLCGPERDSLIAEARQSAERGGHVLADFVHVKGRPVWRAECTRCGQSASINLDPSPGEAGVYGEAVTAACR